MTYLETYCARELIRDEHAMNILTNSGLISDLCVKLKDVAEDDQIAAVEYLKAFMKRGNK